MIPLKVMHVWDQAGVACLLAKYLRKDGHKVDIFKRSGYDPFGILKYYSVSEVDLDGKQFLDLVTEKSEYYDIIHIHSIPSLVSKIKRKNKTCKIVLHYHGSDVRKKPISELIKCNMQADCILVATEDLLAYFPKATYLPNPIDIEHFVFQKRNSKNAFSFYSDGEFPDKTEQLLKNKGINFKINYINRLKNPILYTDLPKFFINYGIYVDIRFIDINNTNKQLITSFSKTALECLASGIRVLSPYFKMEEKLPEIHKPKIVLEKTMEIYQSLMLQK